MESMLPAQLGIVLDMAGGFPFKGRELQKLREQLGQKMFHTHGSKLNHPSLADATKINECPRLHEKKDMNTPIWMYSTHKAYSTTFPFKQDKVLHKATHPPTHIHLETHTSSVGAAGFSL